MNGWIWFLIAAAVIVLLAAAGYFFRIADKDIDSRRDKHGNIVLLDTPRMREFAADSYDRTIEMEKRGHVNSNGMTWNERWLGTIRSIRKGTENPEWYVQYIIDQRRKAGLPELEGVDEAKP